MKIRKGYTFTFGKHKGETVDSVLETDPRYLVWCHNNVEWLILSYPVQKALVERLSRFNKELNKEYVFDFGRHLGMTVSAVLKDDPNYLEWCTNNVAGFVLDDSVMLELDEILQNKHLEKLEMMYLEENGE